MERKRLSKPFLVLSVLGYHAIIAPRFEYKNIIGKICLSIIKYNKITVLGSWIYKQIVLFFIRPIHNKIKVLTPTLNNIFVSFTVIRLLGILTFNAYISKRFIQKAGSLTYICLSNRFHHIYIKFQLNF